MPVHGKITAIAVAAGLICSAATAAFAQQYPTRAIKFVQGFPAGGNADAIVRILSNEMSKSLGQPVIPEARPGAGGNLAAEQVARSAPDGYTLLLTTTAHLISPAIYQSLNYDAVNDFAFLSEVTLVPFFVVTHVESPLKSMKDLVEAARAKPGSVSVGTAGIGTGQHMCLELLASTLGLKLLHVPFRGDAGAVTGLLGKTIDAVIAPGTAVFGNIDGGNFRAIAITSMQRWPARQTVPTIAETVAPNLEMIAWVGVATTRGVPGPIVDRLAKEIQNAVAQDDVNEQLRRLGGFPKSSTPEQTTARVTSEVARWKAVAERTGIPKR